MRLPSGDMVYIRCICRDERQKSGRCVLASQTDRKLPFVDTFAALDGQC
jgi:hypothetical protein